ncbi:MAG: hypothetical protein K6G61_07780 [Solobacterium sp.]|nr:hypothetical protein [Solobacterium sp.]
MEYICQIFTGGWHNSNYTARQIIERLETVTALVPVKKVIIGWNIDSDLYRAVGTYLHDKGIAMLLWLPAFSEIQSLKEADDALDIFGKPIADFALQEGESFAFCCPSSKKNIRNVFSVYEEYFSGIPFDGVFLDKIRTQSFAAGTMGVLSCGCERCRKIYKDKGLSLDMFAKKYADTKDRIFDMEEYDPVKGFRFRDKDTQAFFTIKSEIVADSVHELCRYFKAKGMEVGLDLYAPLMSGIVGQDYPSIAAEADFIKPMLYRKTEAPAGIGFEYGLFRNSVPKAQGMPAFTYDESFLQEQLLSFRDVRCAKYPGIEINYREDIARTDPEYIRSSLSVFKECGMDGAVLSWDVMLAPDSHLQAASEV